MINITDKLKASILKYRQRKLVSRIKSQEKLNIVFIVYLTSMWKYEALFDLLLDDLFFNPLILIAPFKDGSAEREVEEARKFKQYCIEKKYPCVCHAEELASGRSSFFEALSPDIVFFSTPWDYSKGLYYKNIYKKYLTCYQSYGIFTGSLNSYFKFHKKFHQNIWKIFSTNAYENNMYIENTNKYIKNITLTGAIYLDILYKPQFIRRNPWNDREKRRKIIFAPHYTIDSKAMDGFHLSRFLEIHDYMRRIAVEFKDNIAWAFKPHPHLKEKLYKHPNWGKVKTDDYYNFWQSNEFSILSEGDYVSLFHYSDAMIHDCASFIAEYLIVKKPSLYLINAETHKNLNEFGRKALSAHYIAENNYEIRIFIEALIKDSLGIKKEHEDFFVENFQSLHYEKSPAEKIKEAICLNFESVRRIG